MEDKNEVFPPNNHKSSTGLEENIAGLLCYLGTFITGIIFTILEKDSRFVKFHAMQSIVVFVSLWIAGFVLGFVPFVGWLLSMLVSFLGFVLWIVLMAKAYHHERIRIPIASDIADTLLESFNGKTNT
ncbi:hypothetical protein DCC39_12660 [Pueribacillus theae]|uniref:DUF4870 domain-containing protein n=1 Tax=Pueribacillus theae TaxID=2171751 RepID=A0A2U1JY08_9BACI|nr:DUF4870 domain-containing protein [Pueribacillus theae]PWA09688.1 hypothetical protein DCC39_12660 [Pueribacillus theae]